MSDERDSTTDVEDEEVAEKAATDPDTFLSTVPHFYRGEVTLATTAQDRIDRTTDWAVALIAALLSLVFSSPDIPSYPLLIGILVVAIFLLFEVRRYRMYDGHGRGWDSSNRTSSPTRSTRREPNSHTGRWN